MVWGTQCSKKEKRNESEKPRRDKYRLLDNTAISQRLEKYATAPHIYNNSARLTICAKSKPTREYWQIIAALNDTTTAPTARGCFFWLVWIETRANP